MLGQFSRWYLLKQKYDNRKCKAIKGGKSEEVQNMEESLKQLWMHTQWQPQRPRQTLGTHSCEPGLLAWALEEAPTWGKSDAARLLFLLLPVSAPATPSGSLVTGSKEPVHAHIHVYTHACLCTHIQRGGGVGGWGGRREREKESTLQTQTTRS